MGRAMWSDEEIERHTDQSIAKAVKELEAENAALKVELAEVKANKDNVYLERNKVVSALARLFPSGIAETVIEGWNEEWHGCVYIDLPTGQVSWHYHDSQAYLFAHLPPYAKPWDGHDTEEKYRRVLSLDGTQAQQRETQIREALEFAQEYIGRMEGTMNRDNVAAYRLVLKALALTEPPS